MSCLAVAESEGSPDSGSNHFHVLSFYSMFALNIAFMLHAKRKRKALDCSLHVSRTLVERKR